MTPSSHGDMKTRDSLARGRDFDDKHPAPGRGDFNDDNPAHGSGTVERRTRAAPGRHDGSPAPGNGDNNDTTKNSNDKYNVPTRGKEHNNTHGNFNFPTMSSPIFSTDETMDLRRQVADLTAEVEYLKSLTVRNTNHQLQTVAESIRNLSMSVKTQENLKSRTPSSMKLPPLPEFTGNDDIDDWIRNMEMYKTHHQWDDQEAARHAISAIKGEARDQLNLHCNTTGQVLDMLDWTTVRKILEPMYLPRDPAQYYNQQLLNGRQLNKETGHQYIQRIAALLAKVQRYCGQQTDAFRFHTVVNGLLPEYKHRVQDRASMTENQRMSWTDLIKYIRLLDDEFMQKQQQEEAKNTPTSQPFLHTAIEEHPRARPTCDYCDRQGHFEKDCPEQERQRREYYDEGAQHLLGDFSSEDTEESDDYSSDEPEDCVYCGHDHHTTQCKDLRKIMLAS